MILLNLPKRSLDRPLFIKGLAKDSIPQWKHDMVALMDVVIADIEADRLPLPIGKNAYIKEVMGASLLGQLLLAIIVHAEDKETEQLRQTAAEHIETKVHLKAIAKVGERIFPERGVFVCAIDNA